MRTSIFPDPLESRPAAEREADLMARLRHQIAHAQQHSAAYQRLLAGIDAQSITSRSALAALPLTHKHELLAAQQAAHGWHQAPVTERVFAGYATQPYGPGMPRVFASPGPLYEPDSRQHDWRMARAMHAAGFRAGQLVHNSFAYHLVPAGAMMEAAAQQLGCTVFPGGTGQTELQLQAIADLRPQAYVGTPSFLRILLEKVEAQGWLPDWPIRHALVSGEACPPSLQQWLAERGVATCQCYASADLGLIAYEAPGEPGLVIDEDIVVEIVQPGSGTPVPDGDVGEVVVTSFNPDYPLLRFATGDLSALLPAPLDSPRSNGRLKGWLGRADQTTKVRGMFIHPAQVADIGRRLPQCSRLRLLVRGAQARDELILQAELRQPADAQWPACAEAAVREVTRLRAQIETVPPGTLPADGPAIADQRSYA